MKIFSGASIVSFGLFKMKSFRSIFYFACFFLSVLGCKQKNVEVEVTDNVKPTNTAIIPVPKLEDDSYDWWERHKDVLSIKDTLDPEIVLIGNSITHFWGGDFPPLKKADGTSRKANGPHSWEATFHNHRVLNLGFGWDRTQNVLWRFKNCIDGNYAP